MYWDDDARTKTDYTVSTSPAAKTIGVKNSSPYKCATGTCDYGHVAWIESVSNGQVTYTEMNYGYSGVNRKTKPVSFFDAYISKGIPVSGNNYDGKDPNTTGCVSDAITAKSLRDNATGSTLELRWSAKCQTNWTRLVTNSANASASTKVTVTRSRDDKQFSYSGRGSIYSPMVSTGTNVTACASAIVNSYNISGVCR
jgi:hypothetical protein